MVTMAQRIESLRNEVNIGRTELSTMLGFPKLAFEKFETGRQTPTRDQQQKIADYFGVSLFYLKGESNDRTRQDNWMNEATFEPNTQPVATPSPKRIKEAKPEIQSNMIDALFAGQQAQQQLKKMMLEVLKSPEGQVILNQAIRKALSNQ